VRLIPTARNGFGLVSFSAYIYFDRLNRPIVGAY
jgi:hypothetical protein